MGIYVYGNCVCVWSAWVGESVPVHGTVTNLALFFCPQPPYSASYSSWTSSKHRPADITPTTPTNSERQWNSTASLQRTWMLVWRLGSGWGRCSYLPQQAWWHWGRASSSEQLPPHLAQHPHHSLLHQHRHHDQQAPARAVSSTQTAAPMFSSATHHAKARV